MLAQSLTPELINPKLVMQNHIQNKETVKKTKAKLNPIILDQHIKKRKRKKNALLKGS